MTRSPIEIQSPARRPMDEPSTRTASSVILTSRSNRTASAAISAVISLVVLAMGRGSVRVLLKQHPSGGRLITRTADCADTDEGFRRSLKAVGRPGRQQSAHRQHDRDFVPDFPQSASPACFLTHETVCRRAKKCSIPQLSVWVTVTVAESLFPPLGASLPLFPFLVLEDSVHHLLEYIDDIAVVSVFKTRGRTSDTNVSDCDERESNLSAVDLTKRPPPPFAFPRFNRS